MAYGKQTFPKYRKTQAMIISTRQKEQGLTGEFDLQMQNTSILTVEDTKYLGIQIDGHLIWKKAC